MISRSGKNVPVIAWATKNPVGLGKFLTIWGKLYTKADISDARVVQVGRAFLQVERDFALPRL